MRSIIEVLFVSLLVLPTLAWAGKTEQDMLKSCQASIPDSKARETGDSLWKYDSSSFCICMTTKIAKSEVIQPNTKRRLANRWPGAEDKEPVETSPSPERVAQLREILDFQAVCLRQSTRLPFSPYHIMPQPTSKERG